MGSHISIIEQIEAAHPIPNQAGVAATQRILQMAEAAKAVPIKGYSEMDLKSTGQ